MKTLLSAIALTAALSAVALSQVPTDGLVAYYRFNGNVNDGSGNNLNGTITGGVTPTTDRFGNANGAMHFNGTGYVTVPNGPLLQLGVWYTVTGWFMVSGPGPSDFMGMMAKALPSVDGLANPRMSINERPPGSRRYYYMTEVQVGDWHFVAMTFRPDSVFGYQDSVGGGGLFDPVASPSWTFSNSNPLTFGSQGVGFRMFNGSLEDWRIYNRPLSPAEINAIYHEGDWPNPSAGLVAYYPFNGNANDGSGGGSHGLIYGASLTTDRFGAPSRAYHFNQDGNYIEVPVGTSLQLSNSRSIVAWIRIHPSFTPTQSMVVMASGVFNTSTDWSLIVNGDAGLHSRPHMWINGQWRYFNGTTELQSGQWCMVAMTFDGASLRSYVDGVNDGTASYPGIARSASAIMRIGSYTESQGWFAGDIDDIRIYSRALSSAEIDSLYHEGGWPTLSAGLVAHYPFNGKANDASGNGRNGTAYGATLMADRFGKSNSAYGFNGVNTYIKASGVGLPKQDRTVSLWFYANSVSIRPALLGYGGSGYCGNSWLQGLNMGTDPRAAGTFFVYEHCSLYGEKFVARPYGTDEPIAEWFHWVVTTDPSGTRMYLNGTLMSSDGVYFDDTYTGAGDLVFGAFVGADGIGPWVDYTSCNYLDGALDDIRIYDRALSIVEIDSLYREGGWPNPTGAIVVNGGFEYGMSPWRFYHNGGPTNAFSVVTTPPVPEGLFKARIDLDATIGTNNQIWQDWIALEANTAYRISFKHYASASTSFRVRVIEQDDDYTPYGFTWKYVFPTTDVQTYSLDFTTANFTGTVNDAMIQFYFVGGTPSRTIYLDDIVIAKQGGTPPSVQDFRFQVENSCLARMDLRMGFSATATDSIDVALGELELPPPPPSDQFDVRLVLPTTPPMASQRDYRSSAVQQATWRIQLQAGSCGYPLVLTWDDLSAFTGFFTLRDAVNGTIVNVDMKSTRSTTLSNFGVTSLLVEYSRHKTVSVSISSGWQLVSCPLQAGDMAVRAQFPASVGAAFAYSGGYQTVTACEVGKGYWLKFPTGTTNVFTGLPPSSRDIPVVGGWQIVGPFDVSVPVGGITTTPSGIIASLFYEYEGGYRSTTTLQSGRGCWVKASQAGTLHMASSGMKPVVREESPPENVIALSVADGGGNSATLRLTEEAPADVEAELPPLPPSGVFDVRFASNSLCEQQGSGAHELLINSAVYPVTITATGLKDRELLLHDGIEGNILNVSLREGMAARVMAPLSKVVVRLSGATEEVPTEYALFQNYPNPFNPSTTIRYALPEAGHVRLTVFNALGQEVARLVQAERKAGYHEVVFDASSMASGVYLYRLQAGTFVQAKKLVLTR